jgi:heme peroxidase
MKPYGKCADNCYGRLFKPVGRPATSDEWTNAIVSLDKLVDTMEDDGSRPPSPDYAIDVGYTYFGQFLDHDLTNDTTRLKDALSLEPEQIVNQQTPQLDLFHLYGKGPFDPEDGVLYEPGDVRLRVGAEVKSAIGLDGSRVHSFDVALDKNNRPQGADPRVSENIILRQITAVFARLHNVAVEQWRSQIADPRELFLRARLQTAWQFQWLVVKDYLPTVLHPEVYRQVFVRQQPLIEWDAFCIPVEFSVGAMRFGHSMVRDGYLLSNDTVAELETLLRIGLQPGPLDRKFEIDWARFFQGAGPGGPATTTQPIDARISKRMFQIPLGTLQLFNPGVGETVARANDDPGPAATLRLPLATLTRGVAMRLPSGQAVAKEFGEKVLSDRELTCDAAGQITPQGKILTECGFLELTPLWFYILKESEVRENGSCLGRTGSHIVAEVIHAALRCDPDSYMNQPDTTVIPPVWQLGSERRALLSLGALFEAASSF